VARADQPPFDASAMDGYAAALAPIRRAPASPSSARPPQAMPLPAVDGPGQAMRIFTGAPVPEGADDRVVMQEMSPATATGSR
jgi:molybdopterin molybdotransferase